MKKILFIVLALVCTGVKAQWSSDPKDNLQLAGQSIYGTEVCALSDGSWYLYYNGPNEGTTMPWLQYFDKDGNMLWDDEMVITDAPTKTYNVYNNFLFVDRDGNAIVVNQDLRVENYNAYTAYKINKMGEHLWNHTGVSLHGDILPSFAAALKIIQLDDGSYVFCWEEENDISDAIVVRMQRLSPQGERLWGDGKQLAMEQTSITYPYMIDAGNNEFILMYAQGATQELYARKFDFDGNDIWSSPTLVYNGPLPTTPLWTWMKVIPVEGGLAAAWPGYDPEQALLAWIKGDGTHVFLEAEKGLRMGYTENFRCSAPDVVFDAENRVFYSLWREFDAVTQAWQRIAAQKISAEGELLWDPTGVDIAPLEQRSVSYTSVQLGPKGSMLGAFMEMKNAGDNVVGAYAVLVDAEGRYVWMDTAVTIASHENGSCKSSMLSMPMVGDQWIFVWSDFRDFEDLNTHNVYGQNLRVDGTIGVIETGNEYGMPAEEVLQVYPNPVVSSMEITWKNNGPALHNARVELWDLKGSVVATLYNGTLASENNLIEWRRPSGLASGMYLIRAVAGKERSYGKVILK